MSISPAVSDKLDEVRAVGLKEFERLIEDCPFGAENAIVENRIAFLHKCDKFAEEELT